MTKKDQPISRYYLFGDIGIKKYEEGGAKALEDNSVDYLLYEFKEDDNISELLRNYDGWGNHIELTKQQYNEIILEK